MRLPSLLISLLLLSACGSGGSVAYGQPIVATPDGHALKVDASSSATPGDSLDDTAAIQSALDTGESVTFTAAGVYDVSTLTLDASHQSLDIPAGVTLRLASGTNDPVLIVYGDHATVSGAGIIDGNATGQTADCDAVVITGARASLSGLSVIDAKRYGVYGLGSQRLILSGVTITDSRSAAVMVEVNGCDLDGVTIERCTVDRVAMGAYASMGGFHVHGSPSSGAYVARNVTAVLNHVYLPANPAYDSVIGIETWGNCQTVVAGMNTVNGGAMAISLNRTRDAVVTANLGKGQSLYAVEVADSTSVVVNGNVLDGAATGDYGVALTGNGGFSHAVTIAGNTLNGYDHAQVMTYGGASDVTITGNTITYAAGIGMYLASTSRFLIADNTLRADPGHSLYGVYLDHSHPGTVSGNRLSDGGYPWLVLYAAAGVVDGVSATNNYLHAYAPIATAMTGSASLGLYVVTTPNFWH